jgi:hypothetical protein
MNVEEIRNKEKELTEILDSSFAMLAEGASAQEVQQAALEQLQQMEG